MKYDWLLILCIDGGICDHRELKSTICPAHFILSSCHIFPQVLLELDPSCKMNWLFHFYFFIFTTYCWSYQSVQNYLSNTEREKEIHSLFDSQTGYSNLSKCLSKASSYIQESEKNGNSEIWFYIFVLRIKMFKAKKKKSNAML